MLRRLYIENIAVIRRTEVVFGAGFSALTGETGAGKSILVDAINAVLGHRTSREIVRAGADKAGVSAVFDELGEATLSVLEAIGIESEGELMLSREISADGRSACRLNGRPVTVAMLRQVAGTLINIHGQQDNQQLLLAERHLGFVDMFGQLEGELSAYRALYDRYRGLLKEYNGIRMDESEKARRLDLLRFQIDEIEEAKLTPGEDEALLSERKIIQNNEQLSRDLAMASSWLSGDGEGLGAYALLSQTGAAMENAAKFIPEAAPFAAKFQEMAYELENDSGEIREMLESLEYSPERLEEIERRLDLLFRLKRKYGESVAEILTYYEEISAEYERIDANEARMQELEGEVLVLKDQAKEAALALRAKRLSAAKELSVRVRNELSFLDMPAVRFTVSHHPTSLGPTGADSMEFLISVNPGEPEKPIVRIASGGELSRIMLALKNVILKDGVDTLIFDEIDTGVSGRAAQKIGRKLRQAAEGRQIICVTHLAQIAAEATHHLLIEKTLDEGSASTEVITLTREGRTAELARIIGGEPITELNLKSADEMLRKAGN